MKYIIKNKVFSFGGSSTVKDELDNDLFYVKGKVFTLTKKKSICTLDNKVIYKVRNKLFSLFLPKVYITDPNGKELLIIKKKSLFSFRQDFEVITLAGTDHNYSITGDFIGRHYDIYDNGVPVAHVRRNFDIFRDSFWMETDLTEYAPFYIAIVIALDNFYDKATDQSD